MEDFKSQIDLFLTEISIELLGNKIYDINGIRQDKIINLFKAKASSDSSEIYRMNENSNDFLCSLGYQSNFTERNKTVKAFLNSQLDYILKSANTSNKTNTEIIEYLRKYKNETTKLLSEHVQVVNKKKIVEKTQLVSQLNKTRVKRLKQQDISIQKKGEFLRKFYQEERDELLKLSMDTIRLLKYIINDSRNEGLKGELIGFIHAMRSVREKSDPTIPKKPYILPKANSTKQNS